ncbi:MAG TPA: glycosyltransferase family 2 protein [Candidatus Rubrimentiphilum sp.]|nr:glycosyltransferase family 2 protein [Candidatus Rubrimentiphilum sp.]
MPAGMPVLVLDHGSTDRTREIARAHGADVREREFGGFVDARRFAISQVATEWTLMLDADEAIDAQLRRSITGAGPECNGYYVRRTTFYRGRALRMWRDELLLRLFRTKDVRVEPFPSAGGSAQLHERCTCDPPLGTLDGTLLHYSYPTHEAYSTKYDFYTSLEAQGVSPSRTRAAFEVARTVPRFVWYLFGRGAVADGIDGTRIAWRSAFYPAAVRLKALRR